MSSEFISLNKLRREFSKSNKKPIKFNFRKKSKEYFKNNNRTSLHYIHYYPGKIYPFIPKLLLSLDEIKILKGTLLDPFAGSGTVLLEAITNHIVKRNAYGVDINPIARLISKVKTTPLDIDMINRFTPEINEIYSTIKKNEVDIPYFSNIEKWFSSFTITKLSKLKYAITNSGIPEDLIDFYWLCFSSIIRTVSFADPFIPPPVYLKIEKYKNSPEKYNKLLNVLKENENPRIWRIFNQTITENVTRLEAINKVEEIKTGSVHSRIIWDDIKNIKIGKTKQKGRLDKDNAKNLPNNSIDIIMTSPPYITAQKYIRTNKLELFWLDYSEEEVSTLDKEFIGTEKPQLSGFFSSFNIKSIDNLIKRIEKNPGIRSKQVYDYFSQMYLALERMYELIKRNGIVFLVVGDNIVSGKRVPTYQLLTDIATNIGFNNSLILKDTIKARSMMTKRNISGGLIKNEFVVILEKE